MIAVESGLKESRPPAPHPTTANKVMNLRYPKSDLHQFLSMKEPRQCDAQINHNDWNILAHRGTASIFDLSSAKKKKNRK